MVRDSRDRIWVTTDQAQDLYDAAKILLETFDGSNAKREVRAAFILLGDALRKIDAN